MGARSRRSCGRPPISSTRRARASASPIDADLPLVRADGAQLERAFANLLENAARYSGAERVSVRARVVGGAARDPHRRSRSRHPARRARRGSSRPSTAGPSGRDGHKGSGLGLTIVKGFIEANGGRVWAESLPGQGTSFVVAFPLEPQPRRQPPPARLARRERPSAGARLRRRAAHRARAEDRHARGGVRGAAGRVGGPGAAGRHAAAARRGDPRPAAPRRRRGARSAARCASGARCRSSCSPRWATRTTRCGRWRPAPTTT